jgi:cellulose synthase/poly-beta-1,6-N-acetylglucosamine synthase-like glycosyltransferase
METAPFVSVIIPCRNEAGFLGACLDSILASDYPGGRMEVVIADGMSTDGSREILENYSRRFPHVRAVDNPARVTPAALNRAIAAARGEVIVRMDAHAVIARDYLRRAVAHLQRSGADNVGGAMRTLARDRGPFATPVRLALSHRFGVGNSHFRTQASGGASGPRWVDTVFGGCWRREVFERVGGFNERLARGQDMEFNLRLARAGGRILLAPDLHSYYYARATLASFCRHSWTNGVWAMLPFAYSPVLPVRWRHLAPMAFVAALAASFAGPAWLPAAVATPYLAASLGVSAAIAYKERRARLAALLPVAFAVLHLSYGAGSLWGAFRLAGMAASNALPRPTWHRLQPVLAFFRNLLQEAPK